MQTKGTDEKFCSECSAVIKRKAEICPECGVRQIRQVFDEGKKPVYKRIWFWSVVVFIGISVLLVIVEGENESLTTSANPKEGYVSEPKANPIVVNVDTLVEALNKNALNASSTYKGKYVEVTGRLSNIDASGTYFSLDPLYSKFSFQGLICHITIEQRAIVAMFEADDIVTVTGTITGVGEILGYSMKVESFK